jgi:glycine/D-amino acid oxidase-like deaminating enzyme
VKVVVVGGGIVGAACAYFLAREGGSDVTLLEAEELAHGASGRNPGFVWLQGRNPGFQLRVAQAGRELYPQLVEELPLDFEFRESGGLIFFTTPEQGAVAREFVAARCADGLQMELIDGAAVRTLVQPVRPDVVCGAYCAHDAHINTPLVVRALAEGARQAGAAIVEHRPVTALGTDGGRVVGVETAEGRLEADEVVIAAGVWSRALLAAAGVDAPIGAERLQVVATARLPQQVEPCVYGPLAAKQYALFRDLPSWDDAHSREDYEDEAGIEMLEAVAQRRNGEILLGLPMDYPAELDARPTLEGLAAIVRAVATDFPGLRRAPVDRAWAGLLPYTPDTMPVIDRAAPGLIVAAGHVFGNAAGPMTGRLVADLARGRTPSIPLGECRLARGLELAPPGVATRW